MSITPTGKPAHKFGYTQLNFRGVYSAPDLGDGLNITSWNYTIDRELFQVTHPTTKSLFYNRDLTTGKVNSMTTPNDEIVMSYDPTSG